MCQIRDGLALGLGFCFEMDSIAPFDGTFFPPLLMIYVWISYRQFVLALLQQHHYNKNY